jgi:hypothetical protein
MQGLHKMWSAKKVARKKAEQRYRQVSFRFSLYRDLFVLTVCMCTAKGL